VGESLATSQNPLVTPREQGSSKLVAHVFNHTEKPKCQENVQHDLVRLH